MMLFFVSTLLTLCLSFNKLGAVNAFAPTATTATTATATRRTVEGISRRSNDVHIMSKQTSDEDFYNDDIDDIDFSSTKSSSPNFSMDPYSEEAHDWIVHKLGLTESHLQQYQRLTKSLVHWNQRINLMSRKDCTPSVVFGRHILPSLGLLRPIQKQMQQQQQQQQQQEGDDTQQPFRIVDVGTGGGFPGLPLAIALADQPCEFQLVDSVGKKLLVIDDIVEELGLTHIVNTHHGRAEEMVFLFPTATTTTSATATTTTTINHKHAYDICVGRSVTSIPKFCFWVQDLLKPPTTEQQQQQQQQQNNNPGGKLMYIIGGDLDDDILDLAEDDLDIALDIMKQPGISDKRLLIFDQPSVLQIAESTGLLQPDPVKIRKRLLMAPTGSPRSTKKNKKHAAKGAWSKRDNAVPKQRGYENFKRYGY